MSLTWVAFYVFSNAQVFPLGRSGVRENCHQTGEVRVLGDCPNLKLGLKRSRKSFLKKCSSLIINLSNFIG